MSDRDPALEAALHTVEARMLMTRHDYDVPQPVSVLIESGIVYGYHAALRSLGAGTREAQAALREVIRTTLAAERLPIPSVEGMSEDAAYQAVKAWSIDWQMLLKSNRKALRDFARLATPTEEGR